AALTEDLSGATVDDILAPGFTDRCKSAPVASSGRPSTPRPRALPPRRQPAHPAPASARGAPSSTARSLPATPRARRTFTTVSILAATALAVTLTWPWRT